MSQPDLSKRIRLILPAGREYALVASMTLCGAGMLAGLDVDMLGDLRTVTTESLNCLTHQAGRAERVEICAYTAQGRLHVSFYAAERTHTEERDTLELEITRGVLETLMPDVRLLSDEDGVYGIECSMPV